MENRVWGIWYSFLHQTKDQSINLKLPGITQWYTRTHSEKFVQKSLRLIVLLSDGRTKLVKDREEKAGLFQINTECFEQIFDRYKLLFVYHIRLLQPILFVV